MMKNDALQASDDMAAAVATEPRVTLADIEAAVANVFYLTGAEAVAPQYTIGYRHPLAVLTLALVVMRNGFTVVGKSAPASVKNFSPELGKKFAYEDAIRQLWPLMGFALREKLDAQQQAANHP